MGRVNLSNQPNLGQISMEKAADISLPPELHLGKLCRSVPHHGRARTSQGDKLNIIGNGAVFLFSSSKTGGLCVLRSQERLCHAEGIVPAAPASGRYQTWEISAQLIRGWQHSAEPPDGKRQESSSRSAGATAEIVLPALESWHSPHSSHSHLDSAEFPVFHCTVPLLFLSFLSHPIPGAHGSLAWAGMTNPLVASAGN